MTNEERAAQEQMRAHRRQSPARRKELDYDRQRRGFAEYHHSFRHGKWRKKRRAAQKPERQGAVRLLRRFAGEVDFALLEADLKLPVRRRISKWGASTLREWIQRQTARRNWHERQAAGRARVTSPRRRSR